MDEYFTGNRKPPIQYCEEAPPILCHGTVVASTGRALALQPCSLQPAVLLCPLMHCDLKLQTITGAREAAVLPDMCSHADEDVALGCPVEYISLKGTSKEKPAVCKYTGLKYYSKPC